MELCFDDLFDRHLFWTLIWGFPLVRLRLGGTHAAWLSLLELVDLENVLSDGVV